MADRNQSECYWALRRSKDGVGDCFDVEPLGDRVTSSSSARFGPTEFPFEKGVFYVGRITGIGVDACVSGGNFQEALGKSKKVAIGYISRGRKDSTHYMDFTSNPDGEAVEISKTK